MEVIAHRGFSGKWDENTLEAFKAAVQAGANYMELDVYVCSTGELIVVHDENLVRTTGVDTLISGISLSQVREIKTSSGYALPSLMDVMEWLPKGKHLNIELTVTMSFVAAIFIGGLVAGISWFLIQKVKVDPEADRDFHYASVEKVFTPMMIFTACAMAFAHGSNDVANGIGPMAAVVSIISAAKEGAQEIVSQKSALPIWILLVGGTGIVVGLATMGYKVMRTIGTQITELTPSRGYCATLAAAATVVLASRTGLPVSTTHIAVGSVIGVGMARGIGAIDLRVIGGIFVSWIVTLPAGGILAALFFFTLKGMFS